MRALARTTWVELKLFRREPLVLLFVLGGVFGNTPDPEVYRGVGPMDYYVPAYIGLVIASLGIVGLPAHLSAYRERGVLRRFVASSVPMWAVIGAQVMVTLVVAFLGSVLLITVASVTYDIHFPSSVPLVVGGFFLSGLSFSAIGVFLGSAFPTARAAQGAGLMLWFVMMILGGAGPPPEVLTEGMRAVGDATPVRLVILLLQDAWLGFGWNWTEPGRKHRAPLEAERVELPQVGIDCLAGDQLRHPASQRGGELEPVAAGPGVDEHPWSHLADDRLPVGAHVVQAGPATLRLGPCEVGAPPNQRLGQLQHLGSRHLLGEGVRVDLWRRVEGAHQELLAPFGPEVVARLDVGMGDHGLGPPPPKHRHDVPLDRERELRPDPPGQRRRPRSRRDQDARARGPAPVGGFDDDMVVARLDRGDRSAQTGLGPELQGPAEQAGGSGGRVRVPGETLPHGEAHSVQVEAGEALGEGVTIQELDLDPDLGQPAQHLADLRSMLVALKEQEAGLPETGVVPPCDLFEAPKHPDALPGHPGEERVRVVGAADPTGAAGGAERRRLTLEHHGSNPSGRQVVGGGDPVHPCADDGDIEPVHGSILGEDT